MSVVEEAVEIRFLTRSESIRKISRSRRTIPQPLCLCHQSGS